MYKRQAPFSSRYLTIFLAVAALRPETRERRGAEAVFRSTPTALTQSSTTPDVYKRQVEVVRRAAEAAGAPKGAIACITTPTLEATNALMKHDHTRLILATGGGAMEMCIRDRGDGYIQTVRGVGYKMP